MVGQEISLADQKVQVRHRQDSVLVYVGLSKRRPDRILIPDGVKLEVVDGVEKLKITVPVQSIAEVPVQIKLGGVLWYCGCVVTNICSPFADEKVISCAAYWFVTTVPSASSSKLIRLA